MIGARLALVALMLGGIFGCDVGGPTRASTIQNLNGISDDIAAVDMTRSANTRSRDPNISSTLPRNYEVHPDRP
ncbi:MAG TPA: hypothetical protein VGN21_09805 [Stellaceae bacterium]|jgi:hypothetical protein